MEVESPSEIKKSKGSAVNLFHQLYLAIRDRDVRLARGLVERLPSGTLRKKAGTQEHCEANRCFLAAMAARMEGVVLLMIFKGFPSDFCAPIFLPRSQTKNEESKVGEHTLRNFVFPSYFLLAISFGLVHVVRCMIRHAHVNQGWFGLTPLIVAITHSLSDNDTEMVRLLLDSGADPNQGILISQLRALHHLQPSYINNSLDNMDFSPGSYREVNVEGSDCMRILPLDIACAVKSEESVLLLLQK